jgi:hypothetical protein
VQFLPSMIAVPEANTSNLTKLKCEDSPWFSFMLEDLGTLQELQIKLTDSAYNEHWGGVRGWDQICICLLLSTEVWWEWISIIQQQVAALTYVHLPSGHSLPGRHKITDILVCRSYLPGTVRWGPHERSLFCCQSQILERAGASRSDSRTFQWLTASKAFHEALLACLIVYFCPKLRTCPQLRTAFGLLHIVFLFVSNGICDGLQFTIYIFPMRYIQIL